MQKEEFRKLIDKYLEGKASPEDEAQLEQFTDFIVDKERETVFASVQQKEDVHQRMLTNIASDIGKVKRRAFIRTVASIAASVIVLISLGLGYLGLLQPSADYIVVTTDYGQKKTVTLHDGSVVILNAGSELKYPEKFIGNEREVLLKGEAFFEVTKDKSRPFRVYSDKFKTTVLGTSFDVKAYEGETQSVTVATGRVSVASNSDSVLITPNQQVVIGSDGLLTMNKRSADEVYSWRDNKIILNNTSLDELVLVLKRQTGVSFILEDPALKDCRFSGRFENASLDEILQSLKYINGIEYKYINSETVVLQGFCKP